MDPFSGPLYGPKWGRYLTVMGNLQMAGPQASLHCGPELGPNFWATFHGPQCDTQGCKTINGTPHGHKKWAPIPDANVGLLSGPPHGVNDGRYFKVKLGDPCCVPEWGPFSWVGVALLWFDVGVNSLMLP